MRFTTNVGANATLCYRIRLRDVLVSFYEMLMSTGESRKLTGNVNRAVSAVGKMR